MMIGLAGFTVSNFADYFTTWFALSNGKHELNGVILNIATALFNGGVLDAVILVKLIGIGAWFMIIGFVSEKHDKQFGIALAVSAGLFAYIAIQNILVTLA